MYQTIFCQHFVAESCIGLVKNHKIHNSCWKLKSPYTNLYLAKDLHLEEQGPVFVKYLHMHMLDWLQRFFFPFFPIYIFTFLDV